MQRESSALRTRRDKRKERRNRSSFHSGKESLRSLKQIDAGCRACPLWKRGTQTVFGEGLLRSRMMLVGEQPGDAEDREGRPFVGPAGRMLNRALEEAGIDRKEAYVTNVVKHFKWVPKGKLRMHQKPNAREIGACLPWLDAEIQLIRPNE
jgi:uracil-DNA glycosylase family protein